MKNIRNIILFFMLATAIFAKADCDSISVVRPVMAAYTLEAGGARSVDTYLSPLRYSGWHSAVGYERWQAMKQNPEKLVMNLRGSLNFDRITNQVGNASILDGELDLSWSMYCRFSPVTRLSVGVGGGPALNVGCLYSSRNGNNPASARAALTLNASAFVTYSVNLGRLPVTFCYTPSIPVVGAFFSPEYGELYYEIYLGDTDGLVHFAWPGNHFRMDNRLTADIHLGATSLRVGYRLDVFGSAINHLTTRRLTNSFIIGVSGEWLSVNPRRPMSRAAKTISALW